MNIYELECGYIRRFVAAEDEQDAYAKGTDAQLNPDLHYLPFTIRLVEVEGYTITATPVASDPKDMNRDELKQWLTDRGIEFTAQWGESKLRELALQHV